MAITMSRIATRLPSGRDSVEEILARYGRPASERRLFSRVYGLRTSPSLSGGEHMLDLLLGAGCQALGGRKASLVLYGHTLLVQPFGHRDEFVDRVRRQLALPDVPVYGVSRVNCASVLRSAALARRFLERQGAAPDDAVLVLGGDQGSMNAMSRLIPGFVVCGDAAAAFLVCRQEPGRPQDTASQGRYRYLGEAMIRDSRFHRNLRMDADEARAFSAACVRNMAQVVDEALAGSGLGRSDADWIMPHMSNAFLWREVSHRLGISMDRIYLDLLPQQGHTFGVDALMALDHADRVGRLRPGQRCVLTSLGQGAYFQAAVVEVMEEMS